MYRPKNQVREVWHELVQHQCPVSRHEEWVSQQCALCKRFLDLEGAQRGCKNAIYFMLFNNNMNQITIVIMLVSF